jgi:FtsP/CotA-like multicopper oxidase with cupredoxin domain
MTDASHKRLSRRRLLELGVGGIAAGAVGTALIGTGLRSPGSARAGAAADPLPVVPNLKRFALAGSDGFLHLPDASVGTWADDLAWTPDLNVYGYGFRDVTAEQLKLHAWQERLDAGASPTPDATAEAADHALWSAAQDAHTKIFQTKGFTQWQSHLMHFDEGDQVEITLWNLGWQMRPDIPDGHTIHWHGFKNAIPWFDGVPEMSGAAPQNKTFTYFYDVQEPGTYMYHCHWEDVEHIQMGMTGMIFVRPKQYGQSHSPRLRYAGSTYTFDGTGVYKPFSKFTFNDGDGSTGYHREYAMMLMDYDLEQHHKLSHIQQPDWSDYTARAWTINGRAYPDTLAGNGTLSVADDGANNLTKDVTFEVHDLNADATDGALRPDLRYQPQSSLVVCTENERVLIRIACLGYQQHAMTADGITLQVMGRDANLLGNAAYETDTLDVAPGESYDAFFIAPPHSGGTPDPDRYLFYDRNSDNNGAGSSNALGGMATEIWVYPTAANLPDQSDVNELR